MKNSPSPKKRNHYVDFFRGLAAISVIFIHTVWWSGIFYVPDYVRQFSLLFEVPLFFFLAGWSYAYSQNLKKHIKNIAKLQLHYMIFIALFALLLLCLGSQSVTGLNILAWLIHNYLPADKLPVVLGSFWFLAIYISVTLIGVVTINRLRARHLKLILIPLAMLTLYFHLYPLALDFWPFQVIKPDYIVFYLFFYLLGYLLKDVYIKNWWVVAGIAGSISLLLAVLGGALGVNILIVADFKFPPTIIYLLWSLYGVLLVVSLKNKFESMTKNFVSYLGTIALYLFFAQGISSSLIYYYLNYIPIQAWVPKLLIIFAINLGISIALAHGIKILIETTEMYVNKALTVIKRRVNLESPK